MSRLFDYLQNTDTGERRHQPKPLKMVTGKISAHETSLHDSIAKVYRVEARLGAQVVITPELLETVDFTTIIKDKVYRPLAEEIFGEFRQPLIEADLAIFQGEPEKASKLIREVLDKMFKV
jgi:hypothetical protein